MKNKKPDKPGKYQFLSEEESDRLKRIMNGAGGYSFFMNKWMEKGKTSPIPSQNSYYNVINGRSLKSEVFDLIKEIVEEKKEDLQEFKQSLK